MKICVLSYKYPGKHNASDFAFVKQLVDAMANKGHECYVVAPFNISHYRRLTDEKEEYKVGKGLVVVYRPAYLSLSKMHVGNFYFSRWLHKKAVKKALNRLPIVPDVIYGHFWKTAYEGYEFAKRNEIPLFVASGESVISFRRDRLTSEFCDYVKGVICVSTKNKNESINLRLTEDYKCGIYPNAVNNSLFHKRDKNECRRALGIPNDAFVVIFVGWFIERKGPLRVANALNMLDGVNSVFIGKGEQEPNCQGILFKGSLPHDKIPLYLCASDIFVLPTLHEGCCNAVIEAMSCGLPIISSNLPFNWDVLNSDNSILIDPENITEIRDAIMKLKEDKELRLRLSEGSTLSASRLTIEERANKILDFIKSKGDL